MASSEIRSSVPLQISLYFHDLFVYLVFLLTIAGFIYKVAYLLVEKVRLRVMSRGNKTEMVLPMAGGLALALLVAIIHGYYIFGQAYVLRLDQLVQGMSAVWLLIEFVLGLVALVTFLSAPQVY